MPICSGIILLMHDGFPFFLSTRRKCNLIVIYVMCWKMALVWQNSMDENGDVLLENILFEKE